MIETILHPHSGCENIEVRILIREAEHPIIDVLSMNVRPGHAPFETWEVHKMRRSPVGSPHPFPFHMWTGSIPNLDLAAALQMV